VRRVFATMGTVASIRLDTDERAGVVAARALDAVADEFAHLDGEFSRYRQDSPASMVADGRLPLTRASVEHRDVYAEAIGWRNGTGGAFEPHRADGSVDLTGIVKAIAIERAGEVLHAAGFGDWCVNVGGDILVASTASGHTWEAGIADPGDRAALIGSVRLDAPRRAIATSGTSERGDHVWRSDPTSAYRQVTVVADNIVTADVLSTAVLAGGPDTLWRVVDQWDVDVVTIATVDSAVRVTAARTGTTPLR